MTSDRTPPRLGGQGGVVTGAAGGLGGASARRLAREGAHVVAVDIDSDGATTTNSLRPSGGAGRWDPTEPV